MPISQDRMLAVILPANKMMKFLVALKSNLKLNLAQEIAEARGGEPTNLITKVSLILTTLEQLEGPDFTELLILLATEENHFRKTYNRNTRAAVLSDSRRRETGARMRDNVDTPPTFIETGTEALLKASEEKPPIFRDVVEEKPLDPDHPDWLKHVADKQRLKQAPYVAFKDRSPEERARIKVEEETQLQESRAKRAEDQERLREMTDKETGEIFLSSAKTQEELNHVPIPPGSPKPLL